MLLLSSTKNIKPRLKVLDRMEFRIHFKRYSSTLTSLNLPGLAITLFVILLMSQHVLPSNSFADISPHMRCEIATERKVYDVGDEVAISGFIQLNDFVSNVRVRIYVFDWDDGSTTPLVDVKRDFRATMPAQLHDLNRGRPLRWVSDRTGEFGIKVQLEREDDPEKLSISFIKGRFLVLENGLHTDTYTDKLNYVESEKAQIFGVVLSSGSPGLANVRLSLVRGSEEIGEIFSSVEEILAGEELLVSSHLDTTGLSGYYEVQMKIDFEEEREEVSTFTRFRVVSRESKSALSDALSRDLMIQRDHGLLAILSETEALLSNYPGVDGGLVEHIVRGYNDLSEPGREALFLQTSNEERYVTTGDLILWLFTDFAESTGVEISDMEILFSYAAVFDDFFARNVRSDTSWGRNAWSDEADGYVSWLKEYIIGQCNALGVETLRRTAEKYGVVGLMHVINPNFDERFGSTRHNLIPLESYGEVREFAENTMHGDRSILETLLDGEAVEAMDEIQRFLWSRALSPRERDASDARETPTTAGFYETEVSSLLDGGGVTGSCIAVSRLAALIGRSAGVPIGIVYPSRTVGHWGNYIVEGGVMRLDTQSERMFLGDREDSREHMVIKWPSLYQLNREGFGTSMEYRETFGDDLPELTPGMRLEVFLRAMSLELEHLLQD
jgi:hypothetical protein